MNTQQAISKIWKRLPGTLQISIILITILCTIFLLTNQEAINNLTHLFQALPPLIYFPIAIHPTKKVEKEELQQKQSN